LIAWENEAILSLKELGEDEFEIIAPSVSILAEPPVAIVDENVDRKGTREVAQGYLEFLYTEKGQELAAQNYYRPRDEKIAISGTNSNKDKYKIAIEISAILTPLDSFVFFHFSIGLSNDDSIFSPTPGQAHACGSTFG